MSARYLGIQLTKDNNITTGKIYQKVLVRCLFKQSGEEAMLNVVSRAKSARVIISAGRFKLFLTLPTRFRTGSPGSLRSRLMLPARSRTSALVSLADPFMLKYC